jgi:hypothetical protein
MLLSACGFGQATRRQHVATSFSRLECPNCHRRYVVTPDDICSKCKIKMIPYTKPESRNTER